MKSLPLTGWLASSFTVILEVAGWFILVAGALGGAAVGGFFGFLMGLLGACVVLVITLGFLAVMLDVRDTLRRVEVLLSKKEDGEAD